MQWSVVRIAIELRKGRIVISFEQYLLRLIMWSGMHGDLSKPSIVVYVTWSIYSTVKICIIDLLKPGNDWLWIDCLFCWFSLHKLVIHVVHFLLWAQITTYSGYRLTMQGAAYDWGFVFFSRLPLSRTVRFLHRITLFYSCRDAKYTPFWQCLACVELGGEKMIFMLYAVPYFWMLYGAFFSSLPDVKTKPGPFIIPHLGLLLTWCSSKLLLKGREFIVAK